MSESRRFSPLSPPVPDPASRNLRWVNLFGGARSLAVAEVAREYPGLVVVIAADTASALRYEEELPFFNDATAIFHLPDWETLPYDRFSPYQDIVSGRISTLSVLPELRRGVIVISASSLMHRVAPRSWIQSQSFVLQCGSRLDREAFRLRLQHGGYRQSSQVIEHGDYAIRGSIIDVFPMGSDQPFRIDLLDDEIETLRLFDVETQRSLQIVDAINILPAREFPLSPDGIACFRRNWRLAFEGRPGASTIYQDVCEGLAPAGIEYYLPLFFDRLETLFDYIPPESLLILDGDPEQAMDAFRRSVAERFDQLSHDVDRPLLGPERLFLDAATMTEHLAGFAQLTMSGLNLDGHSGSIEFGTRAPIKLPIDARATEPLGLVRGFLERFDGRVLFAAESDGRRETILGLFRDHGIPLKTYRSWTEFLAGDEPAGLCVAPISEGVEIAHPRLALITESQLFGERAAQRRRRRRSGIDQDAIVKSLAELQIGSPVVHEEHGVGRYLGLEILSVGGVDNEYIKLEYADGDKLYVPVASLNLISRYSGIDPNHAPLHKLGSGQWDKAKRRAAERIHDVAAELLEIHARREARPGHRFAIDREAYRSFEQAFPFEETPDQQAAIESVLCDMQSARPMDRLVCGDVGFGKTEVAMRAAFVAVNDGKQVGVLVPTTLLAQQHYQTFCDRFADWPVSVGQLSRFRDTGQTKTTLAGLAQGTVDIVIGTHKLLSRDVKFKDLGLLVIDEEHRFGVRQKEKLKALRAELDILTLTATPIPRTLNLALSGTRELSVIATPPAKRVAITTFIQEWSNALIREAILREIARGGQVYFVHNEVESIERMAKTVAEIIPEARVQFAHGQMREKDLEQVMLAFYHRRCNVLVCTTIIETGIDIPNANTIVMNRADKFGLAQMYQLRGRVGRSHHRAYAYLFVPHRKAMTADAIKRLEAIESLRELGVGFTLATHDMEIRGAGEILGEEQSGQIQEIGFGLYTELLNRAVAALKSGRQPLLDRPLDHGTEIDFHTPALLPADYLPDVHARLILYKRISSARDQSELDLLKEEIIDRFGMYSEPVADLFRVTSFKLRSQALDIKRVDLGPNGGRLEFHDKPNIDPAAIIKLVQTNASYRFDGSEKLRVRKQMSDKDDRFAELEYLLDALRKETREEVTVAH